MKKRSDFLDNEQRQLQQLLQLATHTRTSRDAVITVLHHDGSDGVHFPLKLITTLGSNRKCAVRIKHKTVSNVHATIQLEDGQWILRHMGRNQSTRRLAVFIPAEQQPAKGL